MPSYAPDAMLAFESLSRVLHFLHMLAGIVSLGACVHLLVRVGGGAERLRLHARVLSLSYVTSYALGCLIYPTFRVRVRADLLDRLYPWASGLFEIKEHSATLALLPALALALLAQNLDFRETADRRHQFFFRGLASVVLGVLVYNACVGWYLGTLRSV